MYIVCWYKRAQEIRSDEIRGRKGDPDAVCSGWQRWQDRS